MRTTLIIIISCFPFLYGCLQNKSLHEEFTTLKGIDYSEFSDMGIVNRNGVYFVTYHGEEYKIKRSFVTKKISSVEIAFSNDKNARLTKEDTYFIEHVLESFDKTKLQALSVDEKGNVLLSLPWYERCTYHFLRLSSSSTLEEIEKQHYQNYEDNWYMDKECSE